MSQMIDRVLMQRGWVRIIGGKWRGRRIAIGQEKSLRPTPDRVRETLFNWLSPVIVGARCLDLFAGSGVLGFEALSRGAGFVLMYDASQAVVNTLTAEKTKLAADNLTIYQASIPEELPLVQEPFTIVFLDPPYADPNLPLCFLLEQRQCLASSAYIYVETNAPVDAAKYPAHWSLIKSKKAGLVHYHLFQRGDI